LFILLYEVYPFLFLLLFLFSFIWFLESSFRFPLFSILTSSHLYEQYFALFSRLCKISESEIKASYIQSQRWSRNREVEVAELQKFYCRYIKLGFSLCLAKLLKSAYFVKCFLSELFFEKSTLESSRLCLSNQFEKHLCNIRATICAWSRF